MGSARSAWPLGRGKRRRTSAGGWARGAVGAGLHMAAKEDREGTDGCARVGAEGEADALSPDRRSNAEGRWPMGDGRWPRPGLGRARRRQPRTAGGCGLAAGGSGQASTKPHATCHMPQATRSPALAAPAPAQAQLSHASRLVGGGGARPRPPCPRPRPCRLSAGALWACATAAAARRACACAWCAVCGEHRRAHLFAVLDVRRAPTGRQPPARVLGPTYPCGADAAARSPPLPAGRHWRPCALPRRGPWPCRATPAPPTLATGHRQFDSRGSCVPAPAGPRRSPSPRTLQPAG